MEGTTGREDPQPLEVSETTVAELVQQIEERVEGLAIPAARMWRAIDGEQPLLAAGETPTNTGIRGTLIRVQAQLVHLAMTYVDIAEALERKPRPE